jgi:hypothetical protein
MPMRTFGMFIRWGAPKYVDDAIVFAVSRSEGNVCSFRVSRTLLESLVGRALETPVEMLQGFWCCRAALQRMAVECYQPGARVELHGPSSQSVAGPGEPLSASSTGI